MRLSGSRCFEAILDQAGVLPNALRFYVVLRHCEVGLLAGLEQTDMGTESFLRAFEITNIKDALLHRWWTLTALILQHYLLHLNSADVACAHMRGDSPTALIRGLLMQIRFLALR